MSITRINEFQAHAGQGDTLRQLLVSFLPMIEGSDGCQSCQLLQSQEDPARLVIIEVWDSVEAHQAAVKNIDPDALKAAMELLVGPPRGGSYHS